MLKSQCRHRHPDLSETPVSSSSAATTSTSHKSGCTHMHSNLPDPGVSRKRVENLLHRLPNILIPVREITAASQTKHKHLTKQHPRATQHASPPCTLHNCLFPVEASLLNIPNSERSLKSVDSTAIFFRFIQMFGPEGCYMESSQDVTHLSGDYLIWKVRRKVLKIVLYKYAQNASLRRWLSHSDA
ncbi:unnamed protein product [Periconia digitata]|uniref:Uncharacterized protein n=1 Tax=Periconia digitata TaxID=1303443 RepID=A0A9W4UCN1_9PLEO|nr:unnamed protein product [Periconia digitata]